MCSSVHILSVLCDWSVYLTRDTKISRVILELFPNMFDLSQVLN